MHRETDFLARYGGEEFCSILPDTELSGAVKIAEDMRLAIKDLRLEHAKSKISDIVSLSFGVSAIIPLQGTDPEVLVNVADQALYKAKEEGRDMVK